MWFKADMDPEVETAVRPAAEMSAGSKTGVAKLSEFRSCIRLYSEFPDVDKNAPFRSVCKLAKRQLIFSIRPSLCL
jgi:hypothetical protein